MYGADLISQHSARTFVNDIFQYSKETQCDHHLDEEKWDKALNFEVIFTTKSCRFSSSTVNFNSSNYGQWFSFADSFDIRDRSSVLAEESLDLNYDKDSSILIHNSSEISTCNRSKTDKKPCQHSIETENRIQQINEKWYINELSALQKKKSKLNKRRDVINKKILRTLQNFVKTNNVCHQCKKSDSCDSKRKPAFGSKSKSMLSFVYHLVYNLYGKLVEFNLELKLFVFKMNYVSKLLLVLKLKIFISLILFKNPLNNV